MTASGFILPSANRFFPAWARVPPRRASGGEHVAAPGNHLGKHLLHGAAGAAQFPRGELVQRQPLHEQSAVCQPFTGHRVMLPGVQIARARLPGGEQVADDHVVAAIGMTQAVVDAQYTMFAALDHGGRCVATLPRIQQNFASGLVQAGNAEPLRMPRQQCQGEGCQRCGAGQAPGGGCRGPTNQPGHQGWVDGGKNQQAAGYADPGQQDEACRQRSDDRPGGIGRH